MYAPTPDPRDGPHAPHRQPGSLASAFALALLPAAGVVMASHPNATLGAALGLLAAHLGRRLQARAARRRSRRARRAAREDAAADVSPVRAD